MNDYISNRTSDATTRRLWYKIGMTTPLRTKRVHLVCASGGKWAPSSPWDRNGFDLVYPGLYILLVSWDDVGGGWSYSSSRMEPLVGAASAVAAGIAVGLAATKRLLGGLQAAAYLEAIIFA